MESNTDIVSIVIFNIILSCEKNRFQNDLRTSTIFDIEDH